MGSAAELEPWVYEQLVVAAPEAIVVADPMGTIRFWNPSAEALFGYSAADAIGQTLDLIVPEPQRSRHWAGYRTVMETGQTRYGRELLAVPAVHKDGQRISVEFYVVLLRDAADQLIGIGALIRDVTSRWQGDRALRQRVQALEAELGRRG